MSVRSLSSLALAALFVVAAPAFAAPVTLDFEGVTSFATVGDYYAGGTDGAGVAGGSNLGVPFAGSALALSNDALGPYFSNAPGGTSVLFATDSSAFLNVASGFAGQVVFSYSSTVAATGADAVQIWSGLGGTGALLGSFGLSANAQSDGCTSAAFCHWDRVALGFAGTARSISFGGSASSVAFDNVTIAPVPEPSTTALLALGMVGLVVGARRSRPAKV